MLTEERYNEILGMLSEHKTVTVIELSKQLDASESTVRRDLRALDRMGRLVKVHGGATTVDSQYATRDLEIADRYDMNSEEKRLIAARAASLVGPDDFVYVDAGSTTEAFCDLVTETHATYVTNSIRIADKLVAKGCRTVMLGGELKSATRALVGPDAVESLSRFHFTKGFWGTNGAGPEQGFTTPDINEAEIKRRSMERCGSCYVLCDASKFNQISPIMFARFEDAFVITSHVNDARLRKYKNIVEVVDHAL